MPGMGATKQGSFKSDYLKKPDKDELHIVRMIRPSSNVLYAKTYWNHPVPRDIVPGVESDEGYEYIWCLGSGNPDDADQSEMDEAGVEECSGMGPIGDTGQFLHDLDYNARHWAYMWVHKINVRVNQDGHLSGGQRVEDVMIWDYYNGSATKGTFQQLCQCHNDAVQADHKPHEVLIKMVAEPYGNNKVGVRFKYFGLPSGDFADYEMTAKSEAKALERMKELEPRANPQRTAEQIRALLGAGSSDKGQYDSGLDKPSVDRPTGLA